MEGFTFSQLDLIHRGLCLIASSLHLFGMKNEELETLIEKVHNMMDKGQ